MYTVLDQDDDVDLHSPDSADRNVQFRPYQDDTENYMGPYRNNTGENYEGPFLDNTGENYAQARLNNYYNTEAAATNYPEESFHSQNTPRCRYYIPNTGRGCARKEACNYSHDRVTFEGNGYHNEHPYMPETTAGYQDESYEEEFEAPLEPLRFDVKLMEKVEVKDRGNIVKGRIIGSPEHLYLIKNKKVF